MAKNVAMFKKSGRSAQIYSRRRKSDTDSNSDHDGDELEQEFIRNRSKRQNPMIQSTSKNKLRKIGPTSSNTSSSDDGESFERAKALNIDHYYESSKNAERVGPTDMGATLLNEQETDFAVDAQAQFERVQKQIKLNKEQETEQQEQQQQQQQQQKQKRTTSYKGMALYGAKEKQDSAAGNAANGFVRKGPIRAPQFLRQSVRWDFAPDLCKDYKETGFCTFGDSCKFLHDRTDYKHGWEIERDLEAGRLKEEDEHKYEISDEDEQDQLPFKCFICRLSFTSPVVTKCKHYFCEKCALNHYKNTQKCYVCNKNTFGMFNPAKDIIARMQNDKTQQCKNDEAGDSDEMLDVNEDVKNEDNLLEDTHIEMLDEDDQVANDQDHGDSGSDVGEQHDDDN